MQKAICKKSIEAEHKIVLWGREKRAWPPRKDGEKGKKENGRTSLKTGFRGKAQKREGL